MSERSILVPHTPTEQGLTLDISPWDAGWKHIGFQLLRLPAGACWKGETGEREVGLVGVAGVARVTSSAGEWPEVGGRTSPFEAPPHCLYLPAGTGYQIEARTDLELAICSAPASGEYPARLYSPDDVHAHTRGEGQCTRQIRDMLMEDRPAGSLLLTEVYSPAGNWSSYPPHKHDQDRMPEESILEESYYFHVRPASGFALQRVYTADHSFDQTVAPRHGDLVLVPHGYHMVGAPHGYEVWYLNVLAGPQRALRVSFDPDHLWIKESWDRAW